MLIKRPIKFTDIIGQIRLINEMKNRSKDIDFSHTMILEGNSGSGKSTLASIVASLLNCHNPVKNEEGYYEPCGNCPSCQDIHGERFQRDVHFHDASTMGKEDVVDLEYKASSIPFHDKNNIIIIDEAQELSKKSFGVTLKLLEKKRPNTYFILCTMDTNAISKPIKDRGQTYKFWPVNSQTMAEYLFKITEELDTDKKIPDSFFQDGIFLISEYANGSVRAAIQNLERCLYGELYDKEIIEQELGLLSPDTLANLIMKLLTQDISFFSQLKNQETIIDFYNKSWAALLEAKLVTKGALDGVTIQPWKKKYHQQYMRYESIVDKILTLYQNVFEMSTYLKNDYFLSKIWQTIYEVPILTKKNNPTTVSEQPKRRRKK